MLRLWFAMAAAVLVLMFAYANMLESVTESLVWQVYVANVTPVNATHSLYRIVVNATFYPGLTDAVMEVCGRRAYLGTITHGAVAEAEVVLPASAMCEWRIYGRVPGGGGVVIEGALLTGWASEWWQV